MSTWILLRLSLPSSWLSTSSSPGRPSLWCSSCSMDSTGGTTLSTHKTLSLHVTMSCWNAGQRPRECSFVWRTVYAPNHWFFSKWCKTKMWLSAPVLALINGHWTSRWWRIEWDIVGGQRMILSKSINATSINVHCAIFNDTEKITVLFLPMAMCITQDKRKVALNCFLSFSTGRENFFSYFSN